MLGVPVPRPRVHGRGAGVERPGIRRFDAVSPTVESPMKAPRTLTPCARRVTQPEDRTVPTGTGPGSSPKPGSAPARSPSGSRGNRLVFARTRSDSSVNPSDSSVSPSGSGGKPSASCRSRSASCGNPSVSLPGTRPPPAGTRPPPAEKSAPPPARDPSVSRAGAGPVSPAEPGPLPAGAGPFPAGTRPPPAGTLPSPARTRRPSSGSVTNPAVTPMAPSVTRHLRWEASLTHRADRFLPFDGGRTTHADRSSSSSTSTPDCPANARSE